MSRGLHFILFEKTSASCNIGEFYRCAIGNPTSTLLYIMHHYASIVFISSSVLCTCCLHNLWQLFTQLLVIVSIFSEPMKLSYASMLHTCYIPVGKSTLIINIIPQIQIVQSKKLNLHHVNVGFFTGFHPQNHAYCVCRGIYLIYHGNTRCPACCRGILKIYHGTRKIHKVKDNKNDVMCRRA